MAKKIKLQILNVSLFIFLLLQLLTGIRLWFVNLLGWEDSQTLMNLHLITGFGLAVLVLVHIYTNWWWVKSQFRFSK
jgi:cytochrome b subunit of formate dehydrogenase